MSVLVTAGLLALVGSAEAKKSEVDLSSLSEVAVFGFGGTLDIEQTDTTSGIGVLDAVRDVKEATETLNDFADGSLESAGAERSAGAYNQVAEGLAEAFGWSVVAVDALVADEAYAALWREETPKVNQNLASWGGGMVPPGILHADLAARVDQAQRDALIEALGVDALVTVSLTVAGDDVGVSVAGVGTSRVKPRTTATVTLYLPGEKKQVWRATVMGKKTDEAIAANFGKSEENSSPVILESIDNAMVKLDEKYGT